MGTNLNITYSTCNIGICLPTTSFVLGLNIPDLVVKLLPGLGKLPKNFSVFYHLARKCYPPQKRRYLGLTTYTGFVWVMENLESHGIL